MARPRTCKAGAHCVPIKFKARKSNSWKGDKISPTPKTVAFQARPRGSYEKPPKKSQESLRSIHKKASKRLIHKYFGDSVHNRHYTQSAALIEKYFGHAHPPSPKSKKHAARYGKVSQMKIDK